MTWTLTGTVGTTTKTVGGQTTFTTSNAPAVLTQTGVDMDISGIPTAALQTVTVGSNTASGSSDAVEGPNVESNIPVGVLTGVRTRILHPNVIVRIEGRFYHNHETDRLVITAGGFGSRLLGGHSGLVISGANASYWTSLPSEFTAAGTFGTTNPTGPAVGDEFFRTDLGVIRRFDGAAWIEFTNEEYRNLSWSAGTGLSYTGDWLWSGGTFANSNSPARYGLAVTNAGTLNMSGGRIVGSFNSYFGSAADPITINNYGSAALTPAAFSTIRSGRGSNSFAREPILRYFSGNLNLTDFGINGGSFTLGVNSGTDSAGNGTFFNINRSFSGYGYGFQQHVNGTSAANFFSPTNINSFPTVRNVSVFGNGVDFAVFQNSSTVPAGQRLQNIQQGTLANINGLEAGDATANVTAQNAGYTWMTRQVQTGFSRAPNDLKMATTVQGVMYCTDSDNGVRTRSSHNTTYNDNVDSVYTLRFNDTITDYTVTGGTAAGICALADEREILLAVSNVNRFGTNQPREARDTGRWSLDRRGNSNTAGEDEFTFDIWSYEQEYTRRIAQLTDGSTGDFTFGGVLANDPYITRNRASAMARSDAVGIALGATADELEASVGGAFSLSDIYDIFKYRKETDATQRNNPSVTELPVVPSGTAGSATLSLGSRDLTRVDNFIASEAAEPVFTNLTTTGDMNFGRDITDVTLDAAQIVLSPNFNRARTYTNGGFVLRDNLVLPNGSNDVVTFDNWEISSAGSGTHEISNWSEDIELADVGIIFKDDAIIDINSPAVDAMGNPETEFTANELGFTEGGEFTDSFQIDTDGAEVTVVVTSDNPITITWPIGTPEFISVGDNLENTRFNFNGINNRIQSGNNVTFAVEELVEPAYVDQPNILEITGLPTGSDANVKLWNVTNNRVVNQTPIVTRQANTDATLRFRSQIEPLIASSTEQAIIDIRNTYPTEQINSLGDTETQFELWVYGRTLQARRYVFTVADNQSRINVAANAETNGVAVAVGALSPGDPALTPTVQSTANVIAIAPQVTNLMGQANTNALAGTILIGGTTGAPASIPDGVPCLIVGGGYSIGSDGQRSATQAETNGIMSTFRNLNNYGQSLFNRFGQDTDLNNNNFFHTGEFDDDDTAGTQWDIINTPANNEVNIRHGHYLFDGGDTIEVYTGIYETLDNAAQSLAILEDSTDPNIPDYDSVEEQAAGYVERNAKHVAGTGTVANNPSVISLLRRDAPSVAEIVTGIEASDSGGGFTATDRDTLANVLDSVE